MRFLVLAACVALSGCGAKHAVKTYGTMKYVVGRECKVSLVMTGCDSASPPRCQWMKAKYDRHCEKLMSK